MGNGYIKRRCYTKKGKLCQEKGYIMGEGCGRGNVGFRGKPVTKGGSVKAVEGYVKGVKVTSKGEGCI